jgi:RNA polymerase sigma factor (sigma-70 family)
MLSREEAALLCRMRRGDREAVAQFLTCYGPYIRRRVRGKLSPSMRRLFDSQELLSTLGRRLDRYVQSGRFEAMSDPQFWALVLRIVDHAMIDKRRMMRRLARVEGEDSPVAQALLVRLQQAERMPDRTAEMELSEVMQRLKTPVERQIVSLWLSGRSLRVIGDYLGLSPEAMRQRWQTIRNRLRQELEHLL